MTDTPDPTAFSANEKPREFDVVFRVSGTVRMTIEADDKDDARRKAEAMIDDSRQDWSDIDAEEIDINYVAKSPTMYRVLRDGKKFQVSRLLPGDLPREPDERGF